jgi:probable O-glycosylation ligase (exosortase A-associated)
VRDIALLVCLVPLVVLAVRNSFAAYVFWIWAGLATVNSYTYGFLRSIPWVQVFALISLVHVALRWPEFSKHFRLGAVGGFLIVFCIHIVISQMAAPLSHPAAGEYVTTMFKHLLACMVMPMIITNQRRMQMLVLVMAVSISSHGLIDALKFVVTAGGHNARGAAKFGDNNQYALVLLLGMPVLLHAFRQAQWRWMRWALGAMLPALALAVMATRSRGALACLIVVAAWYVMTGSSKLRNILLISALAILLAFMAPEDWLARMSTMKAANEDSSFMQRIGAWKISAAMALDHPILGAGMHASEVGALWYHYANQSSFLDFIDGGILGGVSDTQGRAAHSIYFEVLGAQGFLGLLWFLTIFGSAFWMNIKTRSNWLRAKAPDAPVPWQAGLAEALNVSLVAYATAGSALSMAYYETPYYFSMLSAILYWRFQPPGVITKPGAAR